MPARLRSDSVFRRDLKTVRHSTSVKTQIMASPWAPVKLTMSKGVRGWQGRNNS